jgi:hypothetical protein
MENQTEQNSSAAPEAVQIEKFINPENQTRYRIVVAGEVTDDLNGMGWRSKEKAANFWDSKNGIQFVKDED